MMPVDVKDLMQKEIKSESSEVIRARVAHARNLQIMRYQSYCEAQSEDTPEFHLNAHASGEYLESITQLDEDGQLLLNKAVDKFKLSARAYHRILRLARTIADLACSEHITKAHLSEAISFRRVLPQLDYGVAA